MCQIGEKDQRIENIKSHSSRFAWFDRKISFNILFVRPLVSG